MNIKQKLIEYYTAYFANEHKPIQIDEKMYKQMVEEPAGKLLKVRPYPENEGLQAGEELLQAMHDVRTTLFNIINKSEVDSFEIWYTNRTISFYFFVRNERTERRLRKQIDAHYNNADISTQNRVMPPFKVGDWVSGSELTMKHSKFYPIKNSMGVREFKSEPYRSVLSDMVVGSEDNMMVQVVFKPAHSSWARGGAFGYLNPFKETVEEVADHMKQEELLEDFKTETRDSMREENRLAEEINRRKELPAYHTNIRVLSFSPNKVDSTENAWSVSRSFEQSYKEAGGQSLIQHPMSGVELRDLIQRTHDRKFENQEMVLTVPELAGIAHIPNESIQVTAVDWNETKAGTRLPPHAERFEPIEDVEFFTTEDEFPDDLPELESNDNIPGLKENPELADSNHEDDYITEIQKDNEQKDSGKSLIEQSESESKNSKKKWLVEFFGFEENRGLVEENYNELLEESNQQSNNHN